MTKCSSCGCGGRWHSRIIPVAILLGAVYAVLILHGIGVI